MPIIASVIAIVMGLLTLKGPMCIFEDKRTLIIPALLGSAKRVYEFESLNQLSMRGGKMFITTDGKSKRIPIIRFMANTDDWSLLIQELGMSDNV